MTSTAYIALGSNLNNPEQQVQSAILSLNADPDIEVMAVSPWYRSAPMGPSGQPDYINGVAKLHTSQPPLTLLRTLQQIENQHHRTRTEHWGPRTLDLDILLYDSQVIDHPDLTVPHPGMTERNFVLYPLADIDPKLVLPGGIPLEQLLEICPTAGIVRLSSGDSSGSTG